MSLRIVLTGAGSGGHLFPLTAVAEKIKRKGEGNGFATEFFFLGPEGKMERETMSEQGIAFRSVMAGKMRRYFSFYYFVDFFKFFLGFFQALWHLLVIMPEVVFAKGGYGSVPVVLAARLYRIPVVIHESDAKPGLANRFLGSIVNRVCLTFERAKIHFPPSITKITGNPINQNVLSGSKEKGREILRMHKEVKPVILVLGGSQGAQIINQRILSILPQLLKMYQVIHQTGVAHYDWAENEAEKQGFKVGSSDYYPIAFAKEELKHFFALADIVISRAGATTIAEIAANQKPAILIPIFQSANDHQKINAFEVSRVGGAIVLEENNLRKNLLLGNIRKIFEEEEFRQQLMERIAPFYNPRAAEEIAEEVLLLAGISLENVDNNSFFDRING